MKHNACYFKISFDMTQYDSIWLNVYIWKLKQRKHKLIMGSFTLPGLVRDFRIYFHNGYLNPYENVWPGRPSSKNMAQAVALWSGFSRSSWRSPERRRTRCWTWLEIVGVEITALIVALRHTSLGQYFQILSDTFSISSVWMQFFDMLTPMDLWHLAGFWFINGTGTIWYPFHLCPGRCSTARQRPNILESESPQLLNGGWNTAGKIMGDFARKSLIRGGDPLVN